MVVTTFALFTLDERAFVRLREITTGGPFGSEHNYEIAVLVYPLFFF